MSSPDAPLARAARVMARRGVKRLPVVAPDGTVQGIVSRSDLLDDVRSAASGAVERS